MNKGVQQVFALSGPVMIVMLSAGFLLAGFLPPPAPSGSAHAIAAIFQDHQGRIRSGLLLALVGSVLLGPFFAAVAHQMRRIQGPGSALASLQTALAAALILEFSMPIMVLQAAVFRPDISPEVIRALDDVAWMLFVGIPTTAALQLFLLAIAVLGDDRAAPVLPRWLGYLSAWAGLLFLPGAVIVFFKDGPFAWNGPFAWWIPLSVFGIWLIATTVVLLRVADDGRLESPDADEVRRLSSRVDALQAELARLHAHG